MTREEAIELLQNTTSASEDFGEDAFWEAADIAIEALKNENALIDSTSTEIDEELDRLLQKLKPINRVKVPDLPDTPNKNTIYTLEQEWIYIDNNWLRIC